MPDTERRLWLEVPASPGIDPVRPVGRRLERMGIACLGREKDYDLASGDNHALGTERNPRSAERPDMGHLQGIGAVPRPDQQRLPADPRGLNDQLRGNSGQAGRLENSEEISHDRTERILKNTLLTLEQDLSATLKAHDTSLVNHQRSLESHAQAIRQLQEKIGQLQTVQAESAQHLQRLSAIHATLEPLLSRLSALLNVR